MELPRTTRLEITDYTIIDYSLMELDYAVKCSLTGDIMSTHRNTFEYYKDAYNTSHKSMWELWLSSTNPSLSVLVQVKYGRNGMIEEFLQVEELSYY
jgi:hypothetical protein